MDNEDVASAPSTPVTPATPGTPGAPLFGGFKAERSWNARKSLLSSCKCFSVEPWPMEEGTLPTVTCSLSPPPVSLARKVGAEFIGTFILIFAGTATAIVNQKTQGSETLIGLAGSTGLAVMIVILSTGHISGAHLNPAITIAFATLRHFPWKHVPVYIGAQVVASLCAAFALKGIFHPIMGGGVTVPSGSYGQAFALEFIISFNLMFVVTAVATDTRAVGELAGIAVGATVMLNILIAGESTGGSMNPVRTLGPAIAANNYRAIWVYLTAPFFGALCGAGIYTAVKLPEEGGDTHERPPTVRSLRIHNLHKLVFCPSMASEKSFSIFQGKSLALPISNPPLRSFFIAQVSLRILATAFSLAAICVMVTSDQSVVVYQIQFDARYSYVSAFKYLVGTDAVASALSLLSLIFVYVFCRPESNPRNYLFVFLHDIVMMVLVMSGCAAATAIGYVGRNGQSRIGWMAVCGDVGSYCNKATISIILSFGAFLSFMTLIITSATQAYSNLCINQEEGEKTTQGK